MSAHNTGAPPPTTKAHTEPTLCQLCSQPHPLHLGALSKGCLGAGRSIQDLHHPLDCFRISGSTNTLQGSKEERTRNRQPCLPGHRWSMVTCTPHSSPLQHSRASTQPASLLRNIQERSERKKTEKCFSLLAKVNFSFPFSGCVPRSSFEDVRLSCLCSGAPSFGSGPRTRNGTGTSLGCPTGWQVQETCLGPGLCSLAQPPQDSPIRVVPSSRTRCCQWEAEEQHLPGAGGRHGWCLGLGEVCSPSTPGTRPPHELGCSTQTCLPQKPGKTGCLCSWEAKA